MPPFKCRTVLEVPAAIRQVLAIGLLVAWDGNLASGASRHPPSSEWTFLRSRSKMQLKARPSGTWRRGSGSVVRIEPCKPPIPTALPLVVAGLRIFFGVIGGVATGRGDLLATRSPPTS